MNQAVHSQFSISKLHNPLTEPASAPRVLRLDDVSYEISENIATLEPEWCAFQQHADGTVFQTFEWLATWQQNIGISRDVRPAVVIGSDPQGTILFLLPLATQPAGFARELVWLGTELCDYNGPLLAQHFSTEFDVANFVQLWERIIAALRQYPRLSFDLIRLEKMPATIGEQPNPMLYLPASLNPSGAHLIALDSSWDNFYASKRSSATRRRDRSKRKRLAASGELRFIEPDNHADALLMVQTLIEQKSCSFARMGVSNFFKRPGYTEFFRAVATDPKMASLVHISQLNVGEDPAAVNLGLAFRNRYYYLLASYTDKKGLSRFGPGAAHLRELLQRAIERGFKYFDFTIGDESYKSDWCNRQLPLYDHIKAHTARGVVAFLSLSVKQRLKRLIKQTPIFWAVFRQARATKAKLFRNTSCPS